MALQLGLPAPSSLQSLMQSICCIANLAATRARKSLRALLGAGKHGLAETAVPEPDYHAMVTGRPLSEQSKTKAGVAWLNSTQYLNPWKCSRMPGYLGTVQQIHQNSPKDALIEW